MLTTLDRPIEILLVEDNPGDARLTLEALKGSSISNNLNVVEDGVQALSFLRREGEFADSPFPNLVLLDLNLPRMDGRELLAVIKRDQQLKRIPVVVLSTSQSERDIEKSYELHANCYITKPVDLDRFMEAVHSIEAFWLSVVNLPSAGTQRSNVRRS